uniref:Bee-milk protein n=1 Tax=Biomphalaria glabrata TaxID=6526 RepID=A0A2C9M4F4_BIOGL
MFLCRIDLLVMLSVVSHVSGDATNSSLNVVHEWVQIEYDWPSDQIKDNYTRRGLYSPEKSHLSGIDVYKDDIYVTVLRMTPAVPSGLNKIVVKNGKSLLQPFPSLQDNELGNCASIQSPFSTLTDPNTGLMYVVDVGRTWRGPPNSYAPCPPKIMVYDLNDKATLIRSHELPESLAPKNESILNDLVLDYITRDGQVARYAYITDIGSVQIIVFDFLTNKSWSFRHDSMKPDEDRVINFNGVNNSELGYPVDGIAMDSSFQYVYYCAIGSRRLYQIPTSVLRDPNGDFAGHVRLLGKKVSNTDGMASGQNSIYYGALTLNAAYKWEKNKDVAEQQVPEGRVTLATQTVVAQDEIKLVFVDSLKVDTEGYLWFTSSRAQKFFTDTMDWTGASGSNYRINKVFVGDRSYLVKGTSVVVG